VIWHLFRKDVRLLWPFALGVTLAQALNAALHLVRLYFPITPSLIPVTIVFPGLVWLGIVCLAVTLVQQEPLLSSAHDWLVRPVKRRDLLLAKLLFVLLLIHVPILLLDFAEALLLGVQVPDALFAALTRAATLFTAFTAPGLLLGAITASLVEAVLVGGVFVILGTLLILYTSTYGPRISPIGGTGLGWVPGAVALITNTLGIAAILAFQYWRRQTRVTRTMVAIGVLASFMLSSLTFDACFTVQQWVSSASAKFDIGLAPGKGTGTPSTVFATGKDLANMRINFNRRLSRSTTPLEFPVRLAGLPPDSVVYADQVVIRLSGSDGRRLYEARGDCARSSHGAGNACIQGELEVSSPASAGYADPLQVIMIPTDVYEALKSQPLSVEIDYLLTLFSGRPPITLGVSEPLHSLAGVGVCSTRIDDDGDEVQLKCVSAHRAPSCVTVVLENPRTGLHDPPLHQCGHDYAPFVRGAYPDALQPFQIGIPFTDLTHTIRFPVDIDQIQQARIAIKTYEPIAHVRRKLVIPGVKLSDWLAPRAAAADPTSGGTYRIMN